MRYGHTPEVEAAYQKLMAEEKRGRPLRRKAESSPAARKARKAAPKDAPGQRGDGRGGARAAEAAGRRDPVWREARRRIEAARRALNKAEKEARNGTSTGSGPGEGIR